MNDIRKRIFGKRTHGHGQQCAGGEEGVRGLNGNGKNIIKIKKKKKLFVEYLG